MNRYLRFILAALALWLSTFWLVRLIAGPVSAANRAGLWAWGGYLNLAMIVLGPLAASVYIYDRMDKLDSVLKGILLGSSVALIFLFLHWVWLSRQMWCSDLCGVDVMLEAMLHGVVLAAVLIALALRMLLKKYRRS